MATNVYFDSGTKPEQFLYEDLIIEQLKIYGQDVYYLPRTIVNEDDLLREDALSTFDDAYLIEMYFENVEGFEGEKEIMSKFGLQMQDEATFVVSKRRFEQLVSVDSNLIVKTRPNEGDLVYFPRVKKMFEILFVDHDDPFYQIHNIPAFKLKVKTFEYSHEDLDTGITEIDAIEEDNSLDQNNYQFTLEDGTTNDSITLEVGSGGVELEVGASPEVFDRNVVGNVINDITLEDGTGNIGLESGVGRIVYEDSVSAVSNIIILESSLSVATGSLLLETGSYIISEAFVIDTIDENSQSDFFDSADDTVIDFSESNPFGDIG